MKRFVLVLTVLGMALSANAQRWTIWYGVNLSNEMKNGALKEWHFANGGVDYTIPVSHLDFTIGAGLNTTGGRRRINYAQLESNAGYRFVDSPKGLKLSAIAGPYLGIKVADDRNDYAPLPPAVKPVTCGWQAGVVMRFRPISLKVGYEQALVGYYDASVSSQYYKADGQPAYPTTRPHSLFIRLGFTF